MDRSFTERNLIQRVNVGDLLARSAARAPKIWRSSMENAGSPMPSPTLWSISAAMRWPALGLARGDALALMSTNNAEFLVVYLPAPSSA